MELVDIYTADRALTGVQKVRGASLGRGEYRLIVFTVIYNRRGELLLTLRAPEKRMYPNLWGNTGGAVQAGETSWQAIAREVWEETGIRAAEEEFELFLSDRKPERHLFTDLYFLRADAPATQLTMQPGETVAAMWVTPARMEQMIAAGQVAAPDAVRWPEVAPALLRRMKQQ